jgi:chromosomal replication initiator protein
VQDVFSEVVAELKERLPAEEYNRWIKPLVGRVSPGRLLCIQVPNIFFKIWIEDHYLIHIRHLCREIAGREMAVTLSSEPPAPAQEPRALAPEAVAALPGRSVSGRIQPNLNIKYTFGNFIVGNSNQLAYAASQAVANMNVSYNPLFIYGGSGLGKTHLLHAIGNTLLSQDPTLEVVYLSSETFTNELIEALRSETMNLFRQRYRSISALLIDDIHFIGGKERTQEEFFYTFNALYETDKQIVLTSDKVPKQIPDLEERLRSRFEGGLFADISPPDQETKVAILVKKAEESNIEISTEVAFFLSSHHESNIRILEGYLSRLGAYAELVGQPITIPMAQQILGQFFETESRQVTLDQILRLTAGFFNVKVSELKSGKKHQSVASPRQVAMFLARKLTSLSTIEIGRRIGGRDHSTVIHADNKVKARVKSDKEFARVLYELEQSIQSSAPGP